MASLTKGVFIVGAKRTPFGAFCGKLSQKTCTDLQEVAGRAALEAAKVNPEWVDSVVIGNVLSCSSVEAPYISRHVALRLGCDVSTPALTVNRLCGSGFQSIVNGAHDIIMGDSQIVLTGGSDNMTQAPHATRGLRTGVKLGTNPQLEDMMWEALTDQHCKTPMGVTAENLAKKYNISRQDADEFAIGSQQKWLAAQQAGHFADEMAPITIKIKRQDTVMDMDEHPKPKSDVASIGKLPSVFKKDGTVTAATASGICDGAGAVVLASEAAVKERGLTPLARLVGYSVAGVDPTIMGIGPAPAIRKLLEKAGLSLADIPLVEINEAFAPQTIACQRELGLDMARLNVSGGAIALGHPLAASGSRITAHLVHTLRRRGEKYAIGSACIGGGQGIALLLEAM